VVLDAPARGAASHQAVLPPLDRAARARATAVVDLSPAPEVAAEAKQHLERSIKAYHAFEYPAALEHLRQGLADAEKNGAHGLDSRELGDLYLYRALTRTQLGDPEAAWADFVQAAVIDPTRKLDAMQFPPRTVEAFERATNAVREDGAAEVVIQAPPSCRVLVDGRSQPARAPIALYRGEHFFRIECSGRLPWIARRLVTEPVELSPRFPAPARPSREEVLAEARRRAAPAVLWARVVDGRGGATLTMRLIDAESGTTRGSVVIAARPERDAAITEAASALLASGETAGELIAVPSRPAATATPWYRRPWVWGIAGAAVATAVLLPFVLDQPDPRGFDVTLGGGLP
jgi:hypothetical protein